MVDGITPATELIVFIENVADSPNALVAWQVHIPCILSTITLRILLEVVQSIINELLTGWNT